MRRTTEAFGRALVLAAAMGAAGFAAPAAAAEPLRVCASQDNMPFSNAAQAGFENKLATLVTDELKRPLAYTWLPAAAAEVAALNAGECDLVMDVPHQLGAVETTHPYYWSGYVLISRSDRKLGLTSLKDHRLRDLRIGVASVGGDPTYTPPAHVMAALGLGKNLVGFPIDGGGDSVGLRKRLVDAVANGDVDLAAVWGPMAGYFVQRSPVKLTVTTIGDTDEFSARKTHFELIALQYEMAMAVRPGNDRLRDAVDEVIARKQPEIDAILRSYGVPLIEPTRLSENGEAAR
ncbi:MAG TPA: quinoprotein dehydrogenase-associated putative ABC transporter substrate-binding protein [Stellaceae bacterium]|nr:quinoprotein dehydrogenase-associated putative ABC transporter substrate-binding protein [Stellaceae bacterium]